MVGGSSPGRGWGFFSSPPCPDRIWGVPSLLSNGYQGLFPWGQSGRGVKLTTHFHLVPRSRMHRIIPPLPQYAFIALCSLKAQDSLILLLPLKVKATGWTIGVRFPVGVGNSLLTTASRPALGLTQPPTQSAPGVPSPGIKRPGRETDNLPHLAPRLIMRGAIPPLPNTSPWHGA
jgi:hypothetical protein